MNDSPDLPSTNLTILWNLFQNACPSMGSRVLTNAGGFVTNIFLARLGSTALAAGAPISVIMRQFASFIIGIQMTASIQMNMGIKADDTQNSELIDFYKLAFYPKIPPF